MTGAGQRDVRSRLYMPTLVDLRYNKRIRRVYQRLLSKGKTEMTEVTACMRKLITILNTVVARNKLWNSEFA